MTVPPYAVAAAMLILFCMASDRLQSRGIFMAVSSAIGGIGYLYVVLLRNNGGTACSDELHRLMLVTENLHVRYFATFCIVGGTYTTIGTIIAWCEHRRGLHTLIF